MLSLKETAECLDISGKFSLLKDFFGYRTESFSNKSESLRTQLQLVQGKHINLDVFLVGLEIDGLIRDFDDEISTALAQARRVYQQANIGVGRVKYYSIHTRDAEGHEAIRTHAEGTALTHKWHGAFADAIDVFLVRDYLRSVAGTNYAGQCWIIGCSKNHGCVLGMRTNNGSTAHALGNLLAHELGHALNLHERYGERNQGNLMRSPVPPHPEIPSLTTWQINRMRRDCFIQDGCSNGSGES